MQPSVRPNIHPWGLAVGALFGLALWALVSPPAVEAQQSEEQAVVTEGGAAERRGLAPLGDFVVGVHIGPSLSVFSDLDPHVMPRLELGYNLPAWGRRLEPHVTISYTPPRAGGEAADVRLPASDSFNWEIRQDELALGIGMLVRFLELGSPINGYAALGPQVVFLRTVANGDAAGEPFGEHVERDTQVGLYGWLGVELVLGPGVGFVELGLAWSDLNGAITGDSNTGNLSPALGYRLML
jgi:hypothetical protein